MQITVDIQLATEADNIPTEADFEHWVAAAIRHCQSPDKPYELSLRIVDESEILELNTQYRNKAKPTNVLSFPTDFPDELDLPLLGDIVICAQVVENEASAQQKPVMAHWAHMTVHGCLHLLGYDHIIDDDAEIMEALETQILTSLGYPAPYEIH